MFVTKKKSPYGGNKYLEILISAIFTCTKNVEDKSIYYFMQGNVHVL